MNKGQPVTADAGASISLSRKSFRLGHEKARKSQGSGQIQDSGCKPRTHQMAWFSQFANAERGGARLAVARDLWRSRCATKDGKICENGIESKEIKSTSYLKFEKLDAIKRTFSCPCRKKLAKKRVLPASRSKQDGFDVFFKSTYPKCRDTSNLTTESDVELKMLSNETKIARFRGSLLDFD